MDLTKELYYRRFQALFADYYSPLCNYALTFVKSAEVSEDIVQEVFTRIWESRREVILEDSARFYLFTAVRNNCITHLRKEKKTGLVEWTDQEIVYEESPQPVKEPDQEINYELLLQEGIDRLPPKCREIFVLSRLSNMKYKEIAESLGISIKTVENQLGKALKLMRLLFREKGIYMYVTLFLVSFFTLLMGVKAVLTF